MLYIPDRGGISNKKAENGGMFYDKTSLVKQVLNQNGFWKDLWQDSNLYLDNEQVIASNDIISATRRFLLHFIL